MKNKMFDEVYTEKYLEDLIEAGYEIAPALYNRNYWRPEMGMTLEDYKQEVAMELTDLFSTRFITPPIENYTKTNLKTYIYSILVGFFNLRLIKRYHDNTLSKHTVSVDKYDLMSTGDGTLEGSSTFSRENMLGADRDYTPEELYLIQEGKALMDKILDTLSIVVPKSRFDFTDKDGVELTDNLVGKLILEGHIQSSVVDRFKGDAEVGNSKAVLIRRRYVRVENHIKEEIQALEPGEIQAVIKYLESLIVH